MSIATNSSGAASVESKSTESSKDTPANIVVRSSNSLYFEVHGSENVSLPPIVFLHGMQSHRKTYEAWVPFFTKQYRVVLFDLKGHGSSLRGNLDFRLPTLATDLKLLLTELHIQKAHIFGHSFGGRVAIQFAAQYPSMVQSLIVEDMDFLPRRNSGRAEDMILIAEKLASLPRYVDTRQVFEDALAPLIGSDSSTTEAAIVQTAKGFSITPQTWADCVTSLFHFWATETNLMPALREVECPMLFVKAGKQSAFPNRAAEILRVKFPHIQLEVIPDGTHSLHRVKAQELLDIVLPFLERASSVVLQQS